MKTLLSRTDEAIAECHRRHPDWSFEKTLRDLCYTLENENTALHKRVATLRRTIARATDEVATLKRLFKLARSVKRRSVSVSCPSRTGLQWSDHETGPVTRRG